jgi:hypothetical protein
MSIERYPCNLIIPDFPNSGATALHKRLPSLLRGSASHARLEALVKCLVSPNEASALAEAELSRPRNTLAADIAYFDPLAGG